MLFDFMGMGTGSQTLEREAVSGVPGGLDASSTGYYLGEDIDFWTTMTSEEQAILEGTEYAEPVEEQTDWADAAKDAIQMINPILQALFPEPPTPEPPVRREARPPEAAARMPGERLEYKPPGIPIWVWILLGFGLFVIVSGKK